MVGSPGSPTSPPPRPVSAMMRPPRSSSRMSMSSRAGGSRASDEDGRTSVKVAVRVRPPLAPTDPGFELIPQRFQKGMVHVSSPTNIAVDSPQGRKIFVFDRVFGQDVTQDGVWEYLEESVGAFVQGYNVSLLAYGQSGAGKSYTMGTSGEQTNPRATGVIPRAAAALFEKLGSGGPSNNRNSGIRAPVRYSMPLHRPNAEKNWTMKASYVEIYNEQLRDLLLPDGTRTEERAQITIREDTKGRILLTGLRQVEISSVEDLLGALEFGSSIRQTDATAINAKSSRSHAVFSLNLVQRKSKGLESKDLKRLSMPAGEMNPEVMTVDSKMHFVDLAGSERLKNTQAQGERAKEGISINAGLASLGKVISQLSSRQAGSHVSYRDSKLTRLLQDSLGGNAITYMIACVTPAEFHLSETLNTIQYAQRARAIQSKPRIQQISDDSDLKALVERLRAEIAFLRQQVKNSTETSDQPRKGLQGSRADRSNEREIELQNQLLDLQENYTALSNRHAKVVSEITRARDTDDPPTPTTEYADTAVERLKRSNSFAEAVETVVLEYEKTIQSLESSLTSTRTSLSNSESTLLEKESKLAYVETVNQQLQARLSKLMDREASTETYLHDLETKLDGHTSGEEKNATIIAELRKEIGRVRENEAASEDYISTLEERLAEAEQDMELMHREIDRLEHVIDRQRSLGKLDNLLLELDHMKEKENGQTNGDGAVEDAAGKSDEKSPEASNGADQERPQSRASAKSDHAEVDGQVIHSGRTSPNPEVTTPQPEVESSTLEEPRNHTTNGEYPPQSPAQTQFVADKLENVQQELFDLKVEHEATLNEYDQMSANYERALRDLAALQDQFDEVRHAKGLGAGINGSVSRGTSPPASPSPRPTSFLVDARVSDLKDSEGQPSSSRSLSSELSLAGDSPLSSEPTEVEVSHIHEIEAVRAASREKEELLARELEKVKQEKETALRAQEEEQERLHIQLRQSLDQLSEFKTKERQNGGVSPGPTQILRRKSSQSLAVLDRAQRAFTNLKRLAAEHLEDEPEILENFELNLEGALRELQTRSERIQELENETASLRKEMDAKMAIINGLTRERTSISTSPMDISVVAVMERRVQESESELHHTRTVLEQREEELASAKRALASRSDESQSEATTLLEELTRERLINAEQSQKMRELQKEVDMIQRVQEEAFGSLKQSRDTLEKTLQDLERELTSERSLRIAVEGEKLSHEERVKSLQNIIAKNKSTIGSQLARVAELERTHSETQSQIETQIAGTNNADDQIKKHKQIAANLQKTIAENRETIENQQSRLATLEESYNTALEQLEALRQKESAALVALKEAEARAAEQITASNSEHERLLSAAQSELEESKGSIQVHLDSLSKLQASYNEAAALIQKLEQNQSVSGGEATKHAETAAALEREVVESKETIQNHVNALQELQDLQAASRKEIEVLNQKEQKHAKLLEDLEQQLAYTFDQNNENADKLVAMTAEYEKVVQERDALVAESGTKSSEAQQLIESLNSEVARLRANLSEVQQELQELGDRPGAQRSNSTSSNSNLRKSTSTVSLPSPPPAIPLPPLPGNLPPVSGTTSPPPTSASTMSRRPSKDYVAAHMEDQEARIKTLEKQLQAEKALTATLEEALTDCEMTMKRLTSDRDSFQAKASQVQQELDRAKNESQSSRYSMQAVEEERLARKKAEEAKAQLEQRMQALSKKQKSRSFACF